MYYCLRAPIHQFKRGPRAHITVYTFTYSIICDILQYPRVLLQHDSVKSSRQGAIDKHCHIVIDAVVIRDAII